MQFLDIGPSHSLGCKGNRPDFGLGKKLVQQFADGGGATCFRMVGVFRGCSGEARLQLLYLDIVFLADFGQADAG